MGPARHRFTHVAASAAVSHFPNFFKGVFACMSRLLGFDRVMPERLWGATGTVDSSK